MSKTWVTATVLQILAEKNRGEVDRTFLAAELAEWVTGRLTQKQRTQATSHLCRLGFVRQHPVLRDLELPYGGRQNQYTVTAEGKAAITEAAAGHVHKSGVLKGSVRAKDRAPTPLARRLWALLRMRTVIDSDSAARTLCNAGDDAEYRRTRAVVVSYLRRWTNADVLEEGARRVGAQPGGTNGFKRFVLKPEWKASPQPPALREIARQRAAAAAQEGIQQ